MLQEMSEILTRLHIANIYQFGAKFSFVEQLGFTSESINQIVFNSLNLMTILLEIPVLILYPISGPLKILWKHKMHKNEKRVNRRTHHYLSFRETWWRLIKQWHLRLLDKSKDLLSQHGSMSSSLALISSNT